MDNSTPTDAGRQFSVEVGRYPLLTPEQEYEIAVRAETGDTDAQTTLVKHNLRFAAMMANGYVREDYPFEEAQSAAHVGLVTASRRFKTAFSVRFVSYAAHWIRMSLTNDRDTFADAFYSRKHAMLTGAMRRALTKLGENTSDEDVLAYFRRNTKISLATIRCVRHDGASLTPLVSGAIEDGSHGVSEESLGAPDDAHEYTGELGEVMDRALSAISPRHADIVRQRFGLPPYIRDHTLEDIASERGISRERIRQLVETSLKRLAKGPYADELKEYLRGHSA